MNFQGVFVFVLIVGIIIGFAYVNFIFPQKLEKEEKQKQSKAKEINKK